jgi:hypothetical protein
MLEYDDKLNLVLLSEEGLKQCGDELREVQVEVLSMIAARAKDKQKH